MTDRLMYNSFRCHTPWLSTEQRNKVLPKYILYVERKWLTLGENALLHEPRILTDKEYLEMKRQLFPNRITGCPILTDYLSSGVLNEIMKDETNAYLRTLREERKSPYKGFPVGAYITQIKDGECGVYRITEPLDEDGCQRAERIVPRRYKNGKRKTEDQRGDLDGVHFTGDISNYHAGRDERETNRIYKIYKMYGR